jgi:twitching motility two-component system response regulator PilG
MRKAYEVTTEETNPGRAQTVGSENLFGYVHGFTVGSFVQMLEFEEKTCTLHVHSNGRSGTMYFSKGVMLNAQIGDLDGESAAYIMLAWDDAQLKLENLCHKKENVIQSSLTRMILEACKRKDENGPAQIMDDELQQAIRLVNGNHFKEAHGRMAAYIKKNPRCSEAWLWYSRCLANMDAAAATLNKCSLYAAPDIRIAEELKKIDAARAHVAGGPVRRCPFCWSPLNSEADTCHYCNARLTIAKALSRDTPEKVNSKLLVEAVTHYTDVVAHETNITALFFLCLANCNLDKVEEALDLLNEAASANPDNQFLSGQLNTLVNCVAARLTCYDNSISDTIDTQLKKIKNRSKKKILVVDDSPTTRKVVTLTLRQKGYTIIEAQDGLEALSKIDEERPDLILLDIILPKMDGYKILSIIKESEDFKDTPVIMLTSKDGIINRVKGKLAGSAAYLTKPFEPNDLIDAVCKHI